MGRVEALTLTLGLVAVTADGNLRHRVKGLEKRPLSWTPQRTPPVSGGGGSPGAGGGGAGVATSLGGQPAAGQEEARTVLSQSLQRDPAALTRRLGVADSSPTAAGEP